MVRYNQRTGRYEVVINNFVYTFKNLIEATEFVASIRGA